MFAIIDDEDYDFLMKWRWRVRRIGDTYYAYRNTHIAGGKCITIHMHRLIMKTPIDLVIDHKDHNGLNNQKSNLRNCTRSQNQMNRRGSGSSKFIGVGWDKNRGKWQVLIKYDGRIHYLGRFDDEIMAAHIYDAKAIEVFGEFANPNFPK